jgi:AAA domain
MSQARPDWLPPGYDEPTTVRSAEEPVEGPAEDSEQDPGWTRLSEIEKESIRYADKPIWQWGTFHELVARKGKGKGTSTASLAARFTLGEFGPKRTVIWIGTEDSPSIDIRPRLEAAGGLPEHVVYVTRHLLLPADISWLRDLAVELGDVGLIVIDPLGNHVVAINTSWDGHVRAAIQGLNPLADELDVVLVGIRHLTEKEAGDLRAGVLGASAWVQVPRVVIAIVDDPADPALKHMHAFMGNRGRPGESGRKLRIEGVLLDGLDEEVTVAVWEGDSTVDIEELFAAANGDDVGKAPSRSAQAREYILDVLDEEGDQESDALDARVAEATGLAATTVRNLRSELSDQGLIKPVPVKDELGSVIEWHVRRTKAPRPRSPLQLSTHKSRDADYRSQIRPDHDHQSGSGANSSDHGSGVSQNRQIPTPAAGGAFTAYLIGENGRCVRHPDESRSWCQECQAIAGRVA